MIEELKLDRQLHVRKGELDLSLIKPVKNEENLPKPKNGFWTSTYINESEGSYFYRTYIMGGTWYLLEPSTVEMFVVGNVNDIHYLLSNYGRQNIFNETTYIDFERLSLEVDALHIKEECFAKGSPVAEFNIKDDMVLNIHDCNLHPFFQWRSESTLWFRNRFDDCKIVKKN